MRVGVAFLLSFLMLVLPELAAGGPTPLSDEELDQITARGVDLSFSVVPDEQRLDLSFQAQSTSGQGSVSVSPTSLPSTLTVNGAASFNLSQTSLLVENLTLNLNICVQCNATTIIQQGIGFPITVKIQP